MIVACSSVAAGGCGGDGTPSVDAGRDSRAVDTNLATDGPAPDATPSADAPAAAIDAGPDAASLDADPADGVGGADTAGGDTASADTTSADADPAPDTGAELDGPPPADAASGSGMVTEPLASGSGYGLVYIGAGTRPGTEDRAVHGVDSRAPAVATFDGAGRLTSYVWDLNEYTRANEAPEIGSAVVDELAGDAVASLGRWNGGTTGGPGTITFTPNQGLHYVVGRPTQAAQVPTSGTVNYQLVAATKPTHSSGSPAPGAFSGGLVIDFTARKLGCAFTLNVGADTQVSTMGGTASPGSSDAVFTTPYDAATGFAINQTSAQPQIFVQCMMFGANAERVGCAVHVRMDATTSLQAAALFAPP
jgi:hypothetical protein